MAGVVAAEPIQGINWSIERGLVTGSTAEAAAQEILGGIADGNPMISFDHVREKHGFSGYLIDGLGYLTEEEIAAPDFAFKSLLVVRKALEPFKDPALLADPDTEHYDQAMVNIIDPGGKVPWHRDDSMWSLAFVNLAAEVKVKAKHIDEAKVTEETLVPGDGFRVTNPKKLKQRPGHAIVNLSDFVRVGYGEYTHKHTADK